MKYIQMYKTVSELKEIINLIIDTETLKVLYNEQHLDSTINILLYSISSYYYICFIYILFFMYITIHLSIHPSIHLIFLINFKESCRHKYVSPLNTLPYLPLTRV